MYKALARKFFFDYNENSTLFSSVVDWNAFYGGEEQMKMDSLVESYLIIPLFDSKYEFFPSSSQLATS